MGLSAFNRAREIRAQLNEQNEQEEQRQAVEAVLLEKLATPAPPAEPAQGAGDHMPPAETVPPAAEPEKPKKQGGSKK